MLESVHCAMQVTQKMKRAVTTAQSKWSKLKKNRIEFERETKECHRQRLKFKTQIKIMKRVNNGVRTFVSRLPAIVIDNVLSQFFA